uniref:Uncharacterized protein n=1 Tax=Anopheles coluzzii TaxID=1518534 RepID=A0A8W7P405_ANOCL
MANVAMREKGLRHVPYVPAPPQHPPPSGANGTKMNVEFSFCWQVDQQLTIKAGRHAGQQNNFKLALHRQALSLICRVYTTSRAAVFIGHPRTHSDTQEQDNRNR